MAVESDEFRTMMSGVTTNRQRRRATDGQEIMQLVNRQGVRPTLRFTVGAQ